MIYREAGQFKTSYRADQAIFPIPQERWAMAGLLVVAFVMIPLLANDYWLNAILLPFLILSLAALGLNILTGYCGQLSLGSAAFMAVGAFAAYNLELRLPDIPLLINFMLAGFVAAAVGMIFGIPSLRIKGFYLAVSTLAAQFFIQWLLIKVGWFSNYSPSGVISAPTMIILGYPLDTPVRKYLLVLGIVTMLTLIAKNMVRGAIGRAWMAVRDMDVAAGVIGIRLVRTKLLAFAVSSFYCGVAGALWVFAYLGNVDAQAFDLGRSLQILFMIIIGGMGSIMGSFIGAAFIILLPIFLNFFAHSLFGDAIRPDLISNLELILFGGLIILFLILEPHGMTRLWQITKEKLRLWPFPYWS